MNIKVFSEMVGLSAHTLRYYEKIGLLKNIQRNSGGHRLYTAHDVAWITFVKRLKETGMQLNEILEYARLSDGGEETINNRQEILIKHRENLVEHMNLLEKHLNALDYKINLYKSGKIC
jgi:DNA-binding transcriptional MerR regulator